MKTVNVFLVMLFLASAVRAEFSESKEMALRRISRTPRMRWLDPNGVPNDVQHNLRGGSVVNQTGAKLLFDATVSQATDLGAKVLFAFTDIPTAGRFAVLADLQGARKLRAAVSTFWVMIVTAVLFWIPLK